MFRPAIQLLRIFWPEGQTRKLSIGENVRVNGGLSGELEPSGVLPCSSRVTAPSCNRVWTPHEQARG